MAFSGISISSFDFIDKILFYSLIFGDILASFLLLIT